MVAEADEVNEAAEVLRPEKSLLRTSESLRFLKFSFILMFCTKKYCGRIMKYHVEF